MAYLESILGNRMEQLIPLKSMLKAGLLLGKGIKEIQVEALYLKGVKYRVSIPDPPGF